MSLIQYAYRFYNDDGGEATSTPYAAENVNITWPLDTAIRLRIGVTHDGGAAPSTSKYMLFASRQGTGQWFEVAAGGSGRIRLSKSTGSPNNIPDGGQNTTNRLTPPTVSPSPTFTPGRIWDDESGSDDVALASGQFTELEFCLAANSALVSNGQIFDFHVMRIPASATPVYVYRGSDSYDGNPAVHSASIDIGTASADRLVVVSIAFRNGSTAAPSSVTVNGVSLTQDVFSNTNQTVGIYSGLVASGSGAQAVVVNWSVGAFTPKFLSVWTITGLTSNVVKHTASFTDANAGAQVSVNIAVSADDLMFGVNAGTGTTPLTFVPSTVAPNADHVETINGGIMNSADWAILATNAAFNVTCGGVTFSGDAAVATYR